MRKLTCALFCAAALAAMTTPALAAFGHIDPGRSADTTAENLDSTDTTTPSAGAPIVSAPADLGDRPADGDVVFVSLTYMPGIDTIGDNFARPATSTIT